MILRENLGIREANPATGKGYSRKVARHLVCRAYDPSISMTRMSWKWTGIEGWEPRADTQSRQSQTLKAQMPAHQRHVGSMHGQEESPDECKLLPPR
jgi:hypothetical protein